MRERHEENLARVRDAVGAMNDNVIRMVQRTRKTLLDSGTLDFVERNRRQMEPMAETHTRVFRPGYFEQLERMSRQFEQVMKPPVINQVLRADSALNVFARGYTRMAEKVGSRLQSVAQPSYFGSLELISRQINESLRPARVESLTRVAEQLRLTLRPRHLESLARIAEQIQQVVKPRYLDQFAELGERLRPFTTTPLFDALREGLVHAVEGYAGWLKERFPEVFVNPDHPPPFLFVVVSLPLAVAVPLLDALVAGDDEPLLQRLEEGIGGTPLVDTVQAAVQQSGALDSIAKRNLVQALDHVRDQRYVDAEPPLYQGLERAFRYDARRRGVIDDDNKFLIAGERRSRATSVEHLFEHLIDDRRLSALPPRLGLRPARQRRAPRGLAGGRAPAVGSPRLRSRCRPAQVLRSGRRANASADDGSRAWPRRRRSG